MLVKVLLIAGVALLPVPALWLGLRGVGERSGFRTSTDRASVFVIITLRVVMLLLVLALSAVVLVSCIGSLVKDVAMPDLVLVFFVLDLLLATLVLLTFGLRDRRPARRRGTPARR